MEEMVGIVDDDNKVTKIVPRSVMRKNKLPHRASYIVLADSQGKFYVEKRTLIKDYCPGMLDACIGGVMQAEEDDIILSAHRELEEEMGVKTNLKYLGWFKIVNKGNAKDFVYAGLFYGVYDGKITMQASEVSTYYMMTLEEILARAEEFTPDSIIAIKEVVRLLNQKPLN